MSQELQTIIDLIRYGASRFNAAGLTFGHSYDNALDEATQLTLHALHLPHDLPPAYGNARITEAEKEDVLGLFLRRIEERIPAAYLTGEAWFAGLSFKVDTRALVPRSPIAELIEAGFQPWLGHREVRRALDLCTGSGCIAIAMAHHNPTGTWTAPTSATTRCRCRPRTKSACTCDNVRFVKSDLFAGLQGEHYDLIVTNPPYVTNDETDALPREYAHEPELGLRAGDDGLDLALRILRDAPLHLTAGRPADLRGRRGRDRAGQPAAGTPVGLGRVQGRADGHLRGRMRRPDRPPRPHRQAGECARCQPGRIQRRTVLTLPA
jgi:ribosomal protein L3 glutamine methyltransferase